MKLKLVCAWLAAGTAMLSAAVFAHGNATGIVGERMMGMMMLGEQVKLLTPILAADPAAVAKAAEMIEMHAGPAMTKLFPEGSIEGPSEAPSFLLILALLLIVLTTSSSSVDSKPVLALTG